VHVRRFGLKRQSNDDENELLEPSRDGLRVKSRQVESFLISVGAQTPVAQRFLRDAPCKMILLVHQILAEPSKMVIIYQIIIVLACLHMRNFELVWAKMSQLYIFTG
jgi:hypothetical protein